MTANQISYAKLQEDVRHNLMVERYNDRMAAVNERNASTNAFNAATAAYNASVNAASVSEAMRHNIVTEQQGQHNLVNAGITAGAAVVGTIAKVVGAIAALA